MRSLPALLVLLMLDGKAFPQPSYSDKDESDFKVHRTPQTRTSSSPAFKESDSVTFPHGTVLYSNLTDLKYYEGPTTTYDERSGFKGRFLVGDRGGGHIQAITTYTDSSNKTRKAYRVFITNPGYVEGRKLDHNRLEGWLPGEYGMVKH